MANKKQRRDRNKRVRQEQAALRRPLEGRTEREVIANGKANELYQDYGEDGLPMTRARTRLKRVLSFYTIWGLICVPIAACWFIASCSTDMTAGVFGVFGLTDSSLGGWSPVVLLRIEAVVTLLGLLSLLVNSFTFSWMFGQASARWFGTLTLVLGVVYAAYLVWFSQTVGVPEPISIVNLVFLVFIWGSAYQVAQERPFLG